MESEQINRLFFELAELKKRVTQLEENEHTKELLK